MSTHDGHQPELAHGSDETCARRMSRRRLLGSGAVVGAAGIIGAARLAQAQNATPAPSAATPASATPASQSAAASGGPVYPQATNLGPAVPPEFTAAATNWPAEGHDLKATRQVAGSSISAQNVDQLGVAWTLRSNVSAAFGAWVSNPVIAGDVLYVQDAMSNVYAVNKETGEEVWTNEYNVAVPSGGPNGVGLGYGLAVYTLGGPGDVIAVKADTGKEVWRTNVRGYRMEGITMAPLVYDSTVYVSTIPGTPESFYNGGQRGVILALDAGTGKVLWYFDTTTDNLWHNARVNSGGGLWHVPSVDDDGQIYVGIGNAAPYPGNTKFPAGSSRPGDNNFACSLLKINPDTGGLEWFINVKPHDLFDLDNQLTPILASLEINGTPTAVAFSSGKHGIVVAADAKTGKELWRTPVGKHQNDTLEKLPDSGTVEVFPGTLGGVETPMAYANGVVVAPVFNMSTAYTKDKLEFSAAAIGKATGELVALDGATGKVLWDTEIPSGPLAGATIVNDLVFTGTLDGLVRAYNLKDGSLVWKWQATSGLNAPLAIAGDYVYVPAGGPMFPSKESATPAPPHVAQVIALKIGGTGSATAGIATPGASPSASPQAGASPVAGGTSVQIAAVDIAFDPPQFTIPANTDVKVTITNKGSLQHDFAIDALKIKTKLLNPGESVAITINAKPGQYQYYCTVPGHKDAGMVGTMTVK